MIRFGRLVGTAVPVFALALGGVACDEQLGDESLTTGPLPGGTVTLALEGAAASDVVYDVRLWVERVDDPFHFDMYDVASGISADAAGKLEARFDCLADSGAETRIIDVVGRVASVAPEAANMPPGDLGAHSDVPDTMERIGEPVRLYRDAQVFRCDSDTGTLARFDVSVGDRAGDDLTHADITVPEFDLEASISLETEGDVHHVDMAFTLDSADSPYIPWGFAVLDGFYSSWEEHDAHSEEMPQAELLEHFVGPEVFRASWMVPSHENQDLPVYTILARSDAGLFNRGGYSLWFSAMQTRPDVASMEVATDVMRVLGHGVVPHDGSFSVGTMINCRRAEIRDVGTGPGMNISYGSNPSAHAVNGELDQSFYAHVEDGELIPSNAIGVVDLGEGEFGVLVHDLDSTGSIFLARCGFARDGENGPMGACDDTNPGWLTQYPVSDLL